MGRIIDSIRYSINRKFPVCEISCAAKGFPDGTIRTSERIAVQRGVDAPTVDFFARDSAYILAQKNPVTGARLNPSLRRQQQVDGWLRLATAAAEELKQQNERGLKLNPRESWVDQWERVDNLNFIGTIERLSHAIETICTPKPKERVLRRFF